MAEQNRTQRNIVRFGVPVAIALGAVAIYVSLDAEGNRAEAACVATTTRAEGLDQYAVGQLAAFRAAVDSTSLVDLAFATADGRSLSIADFAGQVILLNFWATWCGPCREEMPALDALDASMGGDAFGVVAVSLDTINIPDGPREFLAEHQIDELELYIGPASDLIGDIKRIGLRGGLPTTILLDETGCTLGVIEGPADWAGPDAVALIGAAIGE